MYLIGGKEKADDVPARLSKNEFVFTADAVRNAGGGDIDAGAEVMENVMNNLESGGQISEESQGGGGEMISEEEIIEEPNGAQGMQQEMYDGNNKCYNQGWHNGTPVEETDYQDYLEDTAKDYAKQATATYGVPIDTSKFTGQQFVAGRRSLTNVRYC